MLNSNPNANAAGIASTNHQRMSIGNGSISGFVIGVSLIGDSRLIRLEKLQINATTRTAAGGPVGGIAAIIGKNRSSFALVNEVQAVGQIQITCPGLVRNSSAQIVETNVPPDGGAHGFPVDCRGENVITADAS